LGCFKGGNDPTKDLALMMPHFEKNVKIIFKNENFISDIINLAKISLWLNAT
jgi:hypothetical protein